MRPPRSQTNGIEFISDTEPISIIFTCLWIRWRHRQCEIPPKSHHGHEGLELSGMSPIPVSVYKLRGIDLAW